MTRKQKKIQRKIDAILLSSLALTAVISGVRVNAEKNEPIIPELTVSQPTTAPTIEETVEPIIIPMGIKTVVVEATEPSEVEVITETKPQMMLYDVPFDEELQLHIMEQAESHGIDPAIILAMCFRESTYNPAAIGDNGNSLGLMQIQPRWHGELMEQLGCPDLLDPFQNVTVGIHILADHVEYYEGNIEMALVAYNAGRSGANKYWFSQGEYSSDYSRAVMAKADELWVME